LLRDEFPDFLMSVQKFLQKRSPKSLKPLYCSPSDSFSKVVKMLSQKHVHRVWSVTSDNIPQGVISITDIMKLLLEIRVKTK
jgi:CBS domain-containing protein